MEGGREGGEGGREGVSHKVCNIFPGVLDDSEDVLLNPNMIDDERAAKNVELKKSKSTYNPYEEDEMVDDLGNVRTALWSHLPFTKQQLVLR